MIPTTLTRGDRRHGVNRYARTLAAALPEGEAGRCHVHFTDRLWGATPAEAASRFEQHARATPTSVTLHDLPQPSDGERSLPRRAECYRRVVRAARAVACSSAHEAALLVRHTDDRARPEVIPHYVERLPAAPRARLDGSVAVLGFVYPGKGHAEVIDAAATLDPMPPVAILGGAAPGHEPDLEALRARAETTGVALEVTGYLAEDELVPRLRAAAVPVAAHRHVSASGSVATWIAAGRRPLVRDGAYVRELPAGTVTHFDRLPRALTAALREPESTWRRTGVRAGPDPGETARAYAAWWADVRW